MGEYLQLVEQVLKQKVKELEIENRRLVNELEDKTAIIVEECGGRSGKRRSPDYARSPRPPKKLRHPEEVQAAIDRAAARIEAQNKASIEADAEVRAKARQAREAKKALQKSTTGVPKTGESRKKRKGWCG